MLETNQKPSSQMALIIPAITFALANFIVTVNLNVVFLKFDYGEAAKYSAFICLVPAILGAMRGSKIFTDPKMSLSGSFSLGATIGFVSNLVCVGVYFLYLLSEAKNEFVLIALLFGASVYVVISGLGVYGIPITILSGLFGIILYSLRRKIVNS